MEDVTKTKAKRGRRPKNDDVVVVEEKKTRGRKPKTIYNTYDVNTPAIINNNNSSLSDDENIIVRLNVQNDDILQQEQQHPYAYNYNHDEYRDILAISDINSANMNDHQTNQVNVHTNIQQQSQDQVEYSDQLKIVNILKDFEEKNKNKEWPSNTSISCYWCCNKFENAPFGIPITYQHDTFSVFGCFCSLECAAAHNFQSTNNVDEMWERYNLINLLARRINYSKQIRPAPDRLALKMFGGYMEIDQFRNYTKTNKIININFPPMSSISQQIEEINEYELNNDYKYIPLDHERINKIKEQMVIKRVKPLINNKNSLENSMNLKFGI